MPVQADLLGVLLRFGTEDIYRSDNFAGAVFDGFNVYERDMALAVRLLDDDLSVAHAMAACQDIGHRTFRVGHRVPVGAVKTIGATKTNRRIASLRRATPQLCRGSVVANQEASPITDIDADRQEIKQAIGHVQDTLVQKHLRL